MWRFTGAPAASVSQSIDASTAQVDGQILKQFDVLRGRHQLLMTDYLNLLPQRRQYLFGSCVWLAGLLANKVSEVLTERMFDRCRNLWRDRLLQVQHIADAHLRSIDCLVLGLLATRLG